MRDGRRTRRGTSPAGGAILAALVVAVAGLAACGRKGPPVPPELVQPGMPENLSAAVTPEGVRLAWLRPDKYTGGRRMNDLGGFYIERATGEENVSFTRVGTVEVEDQQRFRKERHLEWTDRDVTPGETYRYRAIAYTLDGYRSQPAGPVTVRVGAEGAPSPAKEKP